MIYILAGWQPEITNLETDSTLKMIEAFEQSNFEWRVLVPNFVPFLRYLLAEFRQSADDNFIKFYKQIQNISDANVIPMVMDDLNLPSDVEKVYGRDQVLLLQNGQRFGEVYFNRFGYVKEVHYFKGEYVQKDLFSDFGFILSSTYLDQTNELIERDYFDEKGQVVLTENSNGIRVDAVNQDKFNRLFYANMEDIYSEFLLKNLKHFDPRSDRLIVDGNSRQMMKVSQTFPYQEAIVYSYVDNHSQLTELKAIDYERLLAGKALVTDSLVKYQQLKLLNPLLALKGKVIPIFTSQLNLGASNTVAEQFIYWRINRVDTEFEQLYKQVLSYLSKEAKIRLIIDTPDANEITRLKDILATFIWQNSHIDVESEDYKLFDKYYTAMARGQITAALQEEFELLKASGEKFEEIKRSYEFYHVIQYRIKPDTETFQNDLKQLRLYVNFRNDTNSFMQSMVLSSGVPILSEYSSIYFVDNLNGKHLSKATDLLSALDFYLNGQNNWNKALVESVKQIEINGLAQAIERWQEVLYG
ncbi:hypothetical protein WOSG25_080090 [Weissella oryzae SG25]|uniref:Accessory Sec system protein Asp1 n=1 Tax=Weissella oryzae (strain DSM 25784 / JCM 18191 / LMG 30913 / SG25) TaxID=1329250 RepID=A0A069CUV3_WEIOS|nr:accessory Sec system protein Asp1 [Weissella oryzae]GAK31177.1 hypothetical protein WOSG25_080090 [Weissella oryzae SG25]